MWPLVPAAGHARPAVVAPEGAPGVPDDPVVGPPMIVIIIICLLILLLLLLLLLLIIIIILMILITIIIVVIVILMRTFQLSVLRGVRPISLLRLSLLRLLDSKFPGNYLWT